MSTGYAYTAAEFWGSKISIPVLYLFADISQTPRGHSEETKVIADQLIAAQIDYDFPVTRRRIGIAGRFYRELEEIATLGRDWDGHGAAPISREACQYAWKFAQALSHHLQRFEPFPEPDGSVGLEYHRDEKFSIYLSFSSEGEIAYVTVFRGPERGEEVHRGRGIKARDGIPASIRRFLDAVD